MYRSSLGAATLIDPHLPAGFKFPSPQHYAQSLVNAVGSVSPLLTAPVTMAVNGAGEFVESSFITPLRGQLAVMKATIEGATGVSIGQLVEVGSTINSLIHANSAKDVVKAVGALVKEGLAIAGGIATAVGVAAASLAWVPVIGWIIDVILAVIAIMMELFMVSEKGLQEAEQKCNDYVSQRIGAYCSGFSDRPKASRVTGITPADFFRSIAYAMHRGKPVMVGGIQASGAWLPLSVASMYVGLCAGETEGYFDSYTTSPAPLLSVATKRQMWLLIKAVMAALEPVSIILPQGDGGTCAFALLQELVRSNYRSGRITDAHLVGLNTVIGRRYAMRAVEGGLVERWTGYQHPTWTSQDPVAEDACNAHTNAAHRTIEGWGDCSNMPLAGPFIDQITNFEKLLYAKLYDPATRSWKTNVPKPTSRVRPATASMVTLNSAASRSLINSLAPLKMAPSGTGVHPNLMLTQSQSTLAKLLMAGAAGGAAWYGVRTLGR